MHLDDMLSTWRAQENAPLYGVNRDLLQLVLQHEQADLRRTLRLESWVAYGTSVLLLALLALLVAAIAYNRHPRPVWDYALVGVSALAVLAWGSALYVSRKRQALREQGFGNSLREEIRRNLSLVEYQLSCAGRWTAALLAAAPILAGTSLIYWLIIRINNNPFTWFDAGMIFFIVLTGAWSVTTASRQAKQDLLPRQRRLRELLTMLNASE